MALLASASKYDQMACFQAVVGYEWIQANFQKIIGGESSQLEVEKNQVVLRNGQKSVKLNSEGQLKCEGIQCQPKDYKEYFELPFPNRVTLGVVNFINSFEQKQIVFNHTAQNLHILLDCDPLNIYQKQVDSDRLEISGMQNMIQWLFPNDIEIQFGDEDYMRDLADALNYPLARDLIEYLISLKLNDTLKIAKHHNLTLQKPGLFTKKLHSVDHDGDLLDRSLFQQNLVLVMNGTFIPIELKLDFIHLLRRGIGTRFGHVQELKSQRMDLKIEIKECQGNFVCQNRQIINEKINQYLFNKLVHEFEIRQDMAFFNRWQTYFEMDYSLYLACTGIEARQPQFRVEEDRWIVSTQLSRWYPLDVDLYCNDPEMSMQEIHPELIKKNEKFQRRVKKSLQRFKNEKQYHFLQHFYPGYWRQLKPKVISPFLHVLTTYLPYQELCRDLHNNDLDPKRCALSYSFAHHHDTFDQIPFQKSFNAEFIYWAFNDFFNISFHVYLHRFQTLLGYFILALAAYLHLNSIRISNLPLICFLWTFFSLLPHMLIIQYRYGVDTSAYLNQAGQVYKGQRDYTRLWTNQGPCYYPAGHVWLYMVFYQMFITTDNAEHYFKILHYLCYGVTVVVCTEIGREYLRYDQKKYQMLVLIYMANSKVRREESLLYNDQFMEMLCVLGIYFLACKNWPLVSAGTFSIAISLKAGGMLYLPALLGTIQYRYGTVCLLTSILLMGLWQFIVAAPFILPQIGGKTPFMTYLHLSKFLGGDGQGNPYGWGANWEWSIYWRFIPESWYNSIEFLIYTKIITLFLNFWHFFIQKNSFMRCFSNIFKLPKSTSTSHSDQVFTIEALAIGNMCGVIMCPGGHTQFQFWYSYLIPLLVMMLDLPWWIALVTYQVICPCDHKMPSVHHLSIIALTLWLVFRGKKHKKD